MISMRTCFVLALVFLLQACAGPTIQTDADNSERGRVTIYRDNYGTPQVFSDSNYGVYFGYGYAVAEDRLFQMEMLRRTTEGRVAEVLGDRYLKLDVHIRTCYDLPSVRRQLRALPAADRELLQAYAAGFNRRVQEVLANHTLLPAEFTYYHFLPSSRWTDLDVAMLFVGAIAHRYSDFNSELDNARLLEHLKQLHGSTTAWHMFNASKWLLDTDSPTTVPRSSVNPVPIEPARPAYLTGLNAIPATWRVVLNERGQFYDTSDSPSAAALLRQRIAYEGFSAASPEFAPASNFWAVKNAQDAPGVLVNGPQFGWSVPSYVYGIGLHGGDFNVVGNTLLALPGLLFAHNNYVAWGSTAGLSDQVDVYVEKLNPDNPEQYWHNGKYQTFQHWDEIIRNRDGKPVTVVARRSVHGMVQQVDTKNGRAFSRARAWEGGELATLMAWVNLARDRTLDQVQQRLAKVTTNINFYYMDRDGNLGYTHGGRYPRRVPGQDSRLPTPGTGEWDWKGFRPYAENPTVRNPAQGFIANWNNRPAANWISSDTWSMTWSRAHRVALILKHLRSKKPLTSDEIWQINRETSVADMSAPFLLPYLFDAYAGEHATPLEQKALTVLHNWNRKWLVDSRGNYGAGETLMEAWLSRLLRTVFLDDIGNEFFYLYAPTNNPNKPLGATRSVAPGTKILIHNLDHLRAADGSVTYDFFNGVDYRAVIRTAFAASVQQLRQDQGSDTTAWHIAAQPMQWKPFNFRGVPQALPSALVQLPAFLNRGSENNLFIATGKGIEARDVIPPGQSGYAGNNANLQHHTRDQMQMYADFSLKPVSFTREAVKHEAVSSKTLVYGMTSVSKARVR